MEDSDWEEIEAKLVELELLEPSHLAVALAAERRLLAAGRHTGGIYGRPPKAPRLPAPCRNSRSSADWIGAAMRMPGGPLHDPGGVRIGRIAVALVAVAMAFWALSQ